jgi:uncharacterized protein YjbI with pentapeptide repeats
MTQTASSLLNLITIHNRFPDCLDLDLETLQLDSNITTEFDLYLKLNCHQQWENILGGRVKFAIKGGTFHLTLHNCLIMPQSKLEDHILESPQPSRKSMASVIVTSGETITTTHQESLNWSFYAPFNQLILQGLFSSIPLGKVKITGENPHILGRFTITDQDLSLTDAEGLWKHDLSPNKHSILDRILVKFLNENRFQSVLSLLQIGSKIEEEQLNLNMEEERNLEQLQILIEQIIQAKTDHFLELAQIANLNPKTDFAGANLTATNLRSLDLSESNFLRANFRGADLTDIDLSDSNLAGAKLSGTDLSGAYLANTILRSTHCHGASFALCNLIGADLSGAYLVKANLDNANLTDAKLEGTQFE